MTKRSLREARIARFWTLRRAVEGQASWTAFVARVGGRTNRGRANLNPSQDVARIAGVNFGHPVAAKGGQIKAAAIGSGNLSNEFVLVFMDRSQIRLTIGKALPLGLCVLRFAG